jgi:hypothetical protein
VSAIVGHRRPPAAVSYYTRPPTEAGQARGQPRRSPPKAPRGLTSPGEHERAPPSSRTSCPTASTPPRLWSTQSTGTGASQASRCQGKRGSGESVLDTTGASKASDGPRRQAAIGQARQAPLARRDGHHRGGRPRHLATTGRHAVRRLYADDRSVGGCDYGWFGARAGGTCRPIRGHRGPKALRQARCRLRHGAHDARGKASGSHRRPADRRHQDAGRAPNHTGLARR